MAEQYRGYTIDPKWSPDGRWLVYVAVYLNGEFVKLAPDVPTAKQVVDRKLDE